MEECSEIEAGGEVRTIKDTTARNGVAANAAAIEEINEEMAKLLPLGAKLPIIDLGERYTAELKADIQSGTFKKAVVGGRLTINGRVYYFAHPDYWLHTGDTECTQHHMLVIPEDYLNIGKMNSSNTTSGGYTNSAIRKGSGGITELANVRMQIRTDFGESNILTHRELFTTTITSGKATAAAYANSDIDLMSEVMVYGHNVWASAPGYETGVDKCQLKLFQERPDLITTRSSWWLRSVASASNFACVGADGEVNNQSAATVRGIRPVFAIC